VNASLELISLEGDDLELLQGRLQVKRASHLGGDGELKIRGSGGKGVYALQKVMGVLNGGS
jgi:hypothetical protein